MIIKVGELIIALIFLFLSDEARSLYVNQPVGIRKIYRRKREMKKESRVCKHKN